MNEFKVNPERWPYQPARYAIHRQYSAEGCGLYECAHLFYQKSELESINHTAEKTREFINQRKATMIQEIRSMDTMEESIKRNSDIVNSVAQTGQFLAEKSVSEDRATELMAQKEQLNILKRQVQTNKNQMITALGVTGSVSYHLGSAIQYPVQQLRSIRKIMGLQIRT